MECFRGTRARLASFGSGRDLCDFLEDLDFCDLLDLLEAMLRPPQREDSRRRSSADN